jgi:mycothiol synthase
VELATIADGAVATDTVRALVNRLPSGEGWVLWGRRDVGIEVAQRLRLVETRAIHRMEVAVPLSSTAVVSDDVLIAGLRTGRDEEAWISTNNAAFAGHPENGGVTPDDLAARFSQGWFDAEGIRMAWTDGRLVGSCWTKVHANGVGEIYIVGVHPDAQGSGLGSVLIVEGLCYLAEERGVTMASLWVEDVNAVAVRLYENLGFVRSTTIRQFEAAG